MRFIRAFLVKPLFPSIDASSEPSVPSILTLNKCLRAAHQLFYYYKYYITEEEKEKEKEKQK